MKDLELMFKKLGDEFLEFDRIENKLHQRPDICAFIYLDKLQPKTRDMISAAEHDGIYLDTDCEKLSETITEDDVIYLLRCGVRYSSDYDCLEMYV